MTPVKIILDDDPTGTQAVRGVPVLADWSVDTLRAEFDLGTPAFFILTNSRALYPAAAGRVNREIARNLLSAAAGRPFSIASRGDSTLRGHFPLETDVLSDELGPYDAVILAPYFEAGGRITIHDVHYLRQGEKLIPVGETPFAGDATFGFRSSDLRDYIEEKTGGRLKRGEVVSIPAGLGACGEAACLLALRDGVHAVANLSSQRELEDFCEGLILAEKAGKRFLYRTAADFVREWIGQKPWPALSPGEWLVSSGPGLVIAGSHVPATTAQLEVLIEHGDLAVIEVDVPRLLQNGPDGEVTRVSQEMNAALNAGRDTLVMTSRQLVRSEDPGASLHIAAAVSGAISRIAAALKVRPAWLIAKGGITASDIATQALGVKRSIVPGQLLPGVPVWVTGPETCFPGMPYIVFPGNVGGPDALLKAVCQCRSAQPKKSAIRGNA
jgi:uncharacterized protein YgbK (DUF1537 family)